MKRGTRYPKEVREKAVRMVQEHQDQYPSQWAAIQSIAQKLGMTGETLRAWVRKAESGGGMTLVEGLRNEERIRELERENFELRRSNDILKSAAAFFGAELDRQSSRPSNTSKSTKRSSGSSRSAKN